MYLERSVNLKPNWNMRFVGIPEERAIGIYSIRGKEFDNLTFVQFCLMNKWVQ